MTQEIITVGLHNGIMHTDDVLAAACAGILFHNVNFRRTRDENILNTCDILIDVGGEYDPDKKRFDHHQDGFNERNPAPARHEFGPKYSGVGLFWRHYGLDIIKSVLKSKKLWDTDNTKIQESDIVYMCEQIRRNLVCPIDAIDNGEGDIFYLDRGSYRIPSLNSFIQMFNDDPLEEVSNIDSYYNSQFTDAVDIAEKYLIMNILREYKAIIATAKIKEYIKTDVVDNILILSSYLPWSRYMFEYPEECKDIFYVVFPTRDNTWMIQATYFNYRVDKDRFSDTLPDGSRRKLRYSFPEQIRGKREDELKDLTHIEDITFVHSGGHLAGGKTKESVISLGKWSLNIHQSLK